MGQQPSRTVRPVLPPRTQPLSWLAFSIFVLLLVLLAAVLVQARQYAVLRSVAQAQTQDHAALALRAENHLARLTDQWRQAAFASTPEQAPVLTLHRDWQDWQASMAALREGAREGAQEGASALWPDNTNASAQDSAATFDLAQAFSAAADALLGGPASAPAPQALLQAELPRLQALAEGLRRITAHATEVARTQAQARAQTLRQQSAYSAALTGVLLMLILAIAALALRQVRKLRDRRLKLEELNAELAQARREAVAASDAKSTFLANMSHEIRTPFHGLMGMLSLLRETGLSPKQTDHLRTATESADHLLAILNDILDVSQLESGRLTLAPVNSNVRALLREVEALMRPQATGKGLALYIDAAPAVPERLLLDATRVKQILFNLVSNAVKFSDHGAVGLELRLRPNPGAANAVNNALNNADNSDDNDLEFVVTDSGPGMDESELANLFNRFAPGDPVRTRRHAGAGLGLEISRNLARLMRGDLTVRSKPAEGSVFTFRMPMTRVAQAPATAASGTAEGAGATRALHVLVAEDHPVNRQYMATLLETLGHVAQFANNGQEAVAAATQRSFDVVLMDVHMPLMDGVAATRAIRALPDAARSTVPIVALTADAFDDTRDRCIVAGMNDFLTKPVSPDKLTASLRRLFGHPSPLAPCGSASGVPATRDTPSTTVLDEGAITMVLQTLTRAQYQAMVQTYLDQAPQTVQRLRSAVRDAQPLELRVNAHAAKGAALNLGLAGLAATAEALQLGAAHLPAHEIVRLVQRYEELVPTTRDALVGMGFFETEPVNSSA